VTDLRVLSVIGRVSGYSPREILWELPLHAAFGYLHIAMIERGHRTSWRTLEAALERALDAELSARFPPRGGGKEMEDRR
jgi:hypothetical protein